MPESVHELMERATALLVKMDYAASERLSLEALALCRAAEDWTTYARVVMPLQEARRQRRLNACDAGVMIGGLDAAPGPGQAGVWIAEGVTRGQAAEVDQAARDRGDAVEVLWVARQDRASWTIASFNGLQVSVDLSAPEFSSGSAHESASGAVLPDAAWYLMASEALGDAVIAGCTEPLGSVERVFALAERLPTVLDHEKLHRALAEAARRAV